MMGFGALRVINDDRIAGGAGFPPHAHRDMEIVTYLLEGALEHKDSLGTGSVILPGDVQRMSAGEGIQHSEFNHLKSQPTRLLQIWIIPERAGGRASYEQKNFTRASKLNRFTLVGSRDGREGSVRIAQNVDLWASIIEVKAELSFAAIGGGRIWLQVAVGAIEADGEKLSEGDALAIDGESKLSIRGAGPSDAEILIFELA